MPTRPNKRHGKHPTAAAASTAAVSASASRSSTAETKRRLINRCLEQDPVEIQTLRRLAISRDGLLNDGIRRRVWPKLVGSSLYSSPDLPTEDQLRQHRDYNQVQLDIRRSYKRFPHDARRSHCRRMHADLSDLIMTCLCLSPQSHYYQGFHDVALLWLLAVGSDAALVVLLKVMDCHISDFMDTDMKRTTSMLAFIYTILRHHDPQLEAFLQRSEVGTVFSLSWLLTWFSHVVESTSDATRLQDLFLATHPFMPLYLSAAIILHRREEILSCECELSAVHLLLSRFPQTLPWESLITSALSLHHAYPVSLFARSKAAHCFALQSYESFEDRLWRQPSDTSLCKKMWKRSERAPGRTEDDHHRYQQASTLGRSKPHAANNGGMSTSAAAAGDGAGESVVWQVRRAAFLGVSATVGIASAVLFTLASDSLF
eukprot:scpid65882/ scgid12804/ TBC1 domain family member 20